MAGWRHTGLLGALVTGWFESVPEGLPGALLAGWLKYAPAGILGALLARVAQECTCWWHFWLGDPKVYLRACWLHLLAG